jgi:hypothetical protein
VERCIEQADQRLVGQQPGAADRRPERRGHRKAAARADDVPRPEQESLSTQHPPSVAQHREVPVDGDVVDPVLLRAGARVVVVDQREAPEPRSGAAAGHGSSRSWS